MHRPAYHPEITDLFKVYSYEICKSYECSSMYPALNRNSISQFLLLIIASHIICTAIQQLLEHYGNFLRVRRSGSDNIGDADDNTEIERMLC